MQYHLDLFTPETRQAFTEAGAACTGVGARLRRVANERVKPGDILLCYMTRVSRWCGVLEVESVPFEDDPPRFGATDPYPIRFNVKPVVILNTESAVPIRDPQVWPALTITNRLEPGNPYWTGFFRQSLNTFDDDGSFLVDLLKRQQSGPEAYPLTDQDRRRLNQRQSVRTLTGEVDVSIPDAEDEELSPESRNAESDQRTNYQESVQYQAKVAQIGVEMGFHVWVPRSDKVRVMELLQPAAHEKSLRWKSRWPGINARCPKSVVVHPPKNPRRGPQNAGRGPKKRRLRSPKSAISSSVPALDIALIRATGGRWSDPLHSNPPHL